MTLVGKLHVSLPPQEAFRLFTARGERDWVDGWAPAFPDEVADDATIGTVFETDAHGHHATWIVVDSEENRRIRYARVVTGRDAGTVAVELKPDGDGSEVTVTYQLTALTEAGGDYLATFAENYPAFIDSWAEALASRASHH
ncbi:SRPBCC family protein [Actinoplanes sp. TBRC 11911]|uniref:SRPBCC family protein n=1 Tax=Actinoplanes sp. TBRC 11911 TaxID=2729386 RepID=UPI00145EC507|nr:SRPBCC family protein [Actinoplanes sp. TBRC 11911]NMO56953.1 SRPBCC family protein [Actinoplanes sp. TBRC 11911]